MSFLLSLQGTFSLIIEAWNAESAKHESTENQNTLISRLATHRTLSIGQDWSQDIHYGDNSELHYSYHVVCSEFYHGEACTDYCRPRNDTFGHYTCDEDGTRRCIEGWSEPDKYCAVRKSTFTAKSKKPCLSGLNVSRVLSQLFFLPSTVEPPPSIVLTSFLSERE